VEEGIIEEEGMDLNDKIKSMSGLNEDDEEVDDDFGDFSEDQKESEIGEVAEEFPDASFN